MSEDGWSHITGKVQKPSDATKYCLYVFISTCVLHLSFWVTGYRPFFLGVKRPRSEDNHSHPPCSEVSNECSCTCTLLMCLHGVDRDYVKTDYLNSLL